jgi:hypothetical protein
MALVAPAARAQTKWNEKTVLRFDRPVMIPGKTLQPGTYVFQLADSKSNRNIMQVYTADKNNPVHEDNLVATTLTVPIKREQTNGDVVLKFAETNDQAQEPVALKGFFYPGTMYGHQFVYTDQEAQQIAQQTHTLVLSREMQGTDMQSGTLHNIDASGNRTNWQENPDVAREWAAWIVTWQPAHADNAPQPAAVGTSGRTDMAATAKTTQDHAAAIQRLVDQALSGNGTTVTVDRSTLEQIRMHARAIENGGGAMPDRK